MTQQEHELMVAMFTKQSQFVKVLLDLIRKHQVIPDSELPAFESSVRVDSVTQDRLYRGTLDSYLQAAKAIGIQTGLENSKSSV